MSEIEIAILAIAGTLAGVLLTGILDMYREKWKNNQESQLKTVEKNERIKMELWSPLHSSVRKSQLFLYDHEDFLMMTNRVCRTLNDSILAIDNLIKDNLLLFPDGMSDDLNWYTDYMESISTYFERLNQDYLLGDKQKKNEIISNYKEYCSKLIQRHNQVASAILAGIVVFMRNGTYVSEVTRSMAEERLFEQIKNP
jgi:hypothetical protein